MTAHKIVIVVDMNEPTLIKWAMCSLDFSADRLTEEDYGILKLTKPNALHFIPFGKRFEDAVQTFISCDKNFRDAILTAADNSVVEYQHISLNGKVAHDGSDMAGINEMIIEMIYDSQYLYDGTFTDFLDAMIDAGKIELAREEERILEAL